MVFFIVFVHFLLYVFFFVFSVYEQPFLLFQIKKVYPPPPPPQSSLVWVQVGQWMPKA